MGTPAAFAHRPLSMGKEKITPLGLPGASQCSGPIQNIVEFLFPVKEILPWSFLSFQSRKFVTFRCFTTVLNLLLEPSYPFAPSFSPLADRWGRAVAQIPLDHLCRIHFQGISPESGKGSSGPKVGARGPSSVVRCLKTKICASTGIQVTGPGNLIFNRMT